MVGDKDAEEEEKKKEEMASADEGENTEHDKVRVVRFHPQVTLSFLRPLFDEWLAQADAPPTLEEPAKSHPLYTVDYSYILPLSALPHLHSLHLDLVIDHAINSLSLLMETPFAHLYSLVPS